MLLDSTVTLSSGIFGHCLTFTLLGKLGYLIRCSVTDNINA